MTDRPRRYRIAAIPGDGIGKETVPEGIRVLDAAAARFGFTLDYAHYDWSCETYHRTGAMMPADGLDQLREQRRDPARRGRVSGGAGSRLALGAADPDPPRLRPVREPAAVPADAGRAHAAGRPHRGGHRLLRRAREHRGRVFQPSAAACSRAPSGSSPPSRACSPATAWTGSCAMPSSWRARGRAGTSPRPPSPTASRSPCRTGTSGSR